VPSCENKFCVSALFLTLNAISVDNAPWALTSKIAPNAAPLLFHPIPTLGEFVAKFITSTELVKFLNDQPKPNPVLPVSIPTLCSRFCSQFKVIP